MTFMEKLSAAWKKNNSLVCVGLDPDLKKMPECVTSRKYPILNSIRRLSMQRRPMSAATSRRQLIMPVRMPTTNCL